MEAISKDLRKRVAAAYDRGEGKSTELAERFGVSASWVRRLLQRRRETGPLEPKKYKPGPKRKLSDKQRDRLCELVAKNPDLTLVQLRRRLRLRVALSTLWRELDEAGFSFKRRPSQLASSSETTSKPSVGRGRVG